MAVANNPNATPFPKKFPIQPDKKPSALLQPPPPAGSKILPLIRPKSNPRLRPNSLAPTEGASAPPFLPQKFPAAGAPPYVPVRQQYRMPYHGMAPPVTIRTAVPVFSAPPLPPPAGHHLSPVISPQSMRMASPVRIRQTVPVFAAPPPGSAPAPPVVIHPAQAQAQAKEPLAPVICPAEAKEQPSPAVVISPAVKPAVQEVAETKDVKLAVLECAEVKEVKPADQEETVGREENDSEAAAAIERLKQLEI